MLFKRSLAPAGFKEFQIMSLFVPPVRNRDMSWPEEMSSLANSRSLREKLNLGMSLKITHELFILF